MDTKASTPAPWKAVHVSIISLGQAEKCPFLHIYVDSIVIALCQDLDFCLTL